MDGIHTPTCKDKVLPLYFGLYHALKAFGMAHFSITTKKGGYPMEDEREEIRDDEEEVADEATPETDEEATEQRTDDYDGLVRRLDEIADMVRDRFDAIERAIDALGVSTVEAGADGTAADVAGEAAADVIDELLGIDGLDLL